MVMHPYFAAVGVQRKRDGNILQTHFFRRVSLLACIHVLTYACSTEEIYYFVLLSPGSANIQYNLRFLSIKFFILFLKSAPLQETFYIQPLFHYSKIYRTTSSTDPMGIMWQETQPFIFWLFATVMCFQIMM